VDAKALAWWDTAVRYHLLHALALVLAGILGRRGARVRLAGWGFLLGIALFSGTLYAMALGGPHWLGMVTPVGGVGLLLGWWGIVLAGRSAAASPGDAAPPGAA
jgi:uncharacterized membrane protein YgdD (TMEM256/DUF423 family)